MLTFLGELLAARPGAQVNFLGMWCAFACLIGLLFLVAMLAAALQKSLKLGLILVAHLVFYVLTFDRLVVYLAQVKNLHDL